MASFRFRSNRWQARVRRAGSPDETRSFVTRQDAEKWSRSVESEIDRGSRSMPSQANKLNLGELIDRYMVEVLPSMKGAHEDAIRLKAIRRNPICHFSLEALTPSRLAQYRDLRLKQVAPATVIRELAYLSSIINHGRREWGLTIGNPVALVRKPASPKGRERTLSPSEQEILFAELQPSGRRSLWMLAIVKLAIETAMRRSELLSLDWKHINLKDRVALLETTKNGDSRTVPLSKVAIAILEALPRNDDGRVFPMSGCGVSAAFVRAAKRARLADVKFHDLRHTAITQLALKLPNLIELSAVSGHKSLKMLQRYYHPRAKDLALKLD